MPKLVALVNRPWYGAGPAGGAETMIHDLCNYAGRRGWGVRATTVDPQRWELMQHDYVRWETTEDIDELNSMVAEADVLITHLEATPGAAALAETHGKPLVQIIHNTHAKTAQFMSLGGYFVYNSNWVTDHFGGFPGVTVRPPALSPPSKMGAAEGAITQINLCANKGPEVFYSMARNMPKRQFLGVLGGYLPKKQLIKGGKNIRFHEHTHDIDSFYSKTAILVVPSHYESYGRVAVEAMGRGIPVIASGAPGLCESVADGGFLLPRHKISAWVAAAKTILGDYETYQVKALNRYECLRTQSEVEMLAFWDLLEDLC